MTTRSLLLPIACALPLLSGCGLLGDALDPTPPDVTSIALVERSDAATGTTVRLGIGYRDPDLSLSTVVLGYRFDTGESGQRTFHTIVDDEIYGGNLTGFSLEPGEDEGAGTVRLDIEWGDSIHLDVNVGLGTSDGETGATGSIRVPR